jgi:hypothetical protein
VLGVSGMYTVGSSPEEFAAFLKQDYAYQDKLMGELGLKVMANRVRPLFAIHHSLLAILNETASEISPAVCRAGRR